MDKQTFHRSTERVLDILELAASDAGGFTLTEIAQRIGAPKSSLFPIIRTMAEKKYLQANTQTGRYCIGVKALEVGYAYLQDTGIIEDVREQMRQIVENCGETCHFGQLDGQEVIYLLKVDSPQSIRTFSSVGKRLPAYITAIGKALLSDLDYDQLAALYAEGLRAVTPHTITDLPTLYEQLAAIHAGEFATEVEESEPLIRCVALPVRKDGRVVAALSVAIPVFRYEEGKLQNIQSLLLGARERIESLLRMSGFSSFSAG